MTLNNKGLYRGYIKVYIGVILGLLYSILGVIMGIMEKKMEITIMDYRFEIEGLSMTSLNFRRSCMWLPRHVAQVKHASLLRGALEGELCCAVCSCHAQKSSVWLSEVKSNVHVQDT